MCFQISNKIIELCLEMSVDLDFLLLRRQVMVYRSLYLFFCFPSCTPFPSFVHLHTSSESTSLVRPCSISSFSSPVFLCPSLQLHFISSSDRLHLSFQSCLCGILLFHSCTSNTLIKRLLLHPLNVTKILL